MNDLELIPANKTRSSSDWSENEYDVMFRESGETIGIIFRISPNLWFWGIGDRRSGEPLLCIALRAIKQGTFYDRELRNPV